MLVMTRAEPQAYCVQKGSGGGNQHRIRDEREKHVLTNALRAQGAKAFLD